MARILLTRHRSVSFLGALTLRSCSTAPLGVSSQDYMQEKTKCKTRPKSLSQEIWSSGLIRHVKATRQSRVSDAVQTWNLRKRVCIGILCCRYSSQWCNTIQFHHRSKWWGMYSSLTLHGTLIKSQKQDLPISSKRNLDDQAIVCHTTLEHSRWAVVLNLFNDEQPSSKLLH